MRSIIILVSVFLIVLLMISVQMDLFGDSILAYAQVSRPPFLPGPAAPFSSNDASTITANNKTVSSSNQNLSRTTTALLPYSSAINGIYLLFPSSWTPSVAGLSYPELIRFYLPLQNLSDILPPQVTISLTRYTNNISLVEFTNLTLSSLESTATNPSSQQPQLTIENSNHSTISGYPAESVIFSLSPPPSSSNITNSARFNVLETWTVVNDRIYLISYNALISKFNAYLPEFNQMISSIRFANRLVS